MLNIFFINCFQVIVVSCNYTFSSVPLDPQPYTCRVCEIMAMYVVYQRTCLTQPHFCVCPKSEALAFVILYVFEWSSSICFAPLGAEFSSCVDVPFLDSCCFLLFGQVVVALSLWYMMGSLIIYICILQVNQVIISHQRWNKTGLINKQ